MHLKKILVRFFLIVFALYVCGCAYLYSVQESLLFHPAKLDESRALSFAVPFDELAVKTPDGNQLSGALFQSDQSTGKLVFFLHGNAGNIEDLEGVAEFYTDLGYDFCSFDYRGFGKSTGTIVSENQFYADARKVYAAMKARYREQNITIIGYSIGSAAAAMLAAENHPAGLVLMAPYYSMEDLATQRYKIIPTFLVSYRFATAGFLPKINVPVCIFHGKNDETIPYDSSKRLSGLLKKGDLFVPLENQGHGGIEQHPVFKRNITAFLK
jgi:pimeloyl-ACP methyl ester carboxylesterase